MENSKHILNCDLRTFIIKFQNKSTNARFIFQTGYELMFILSTYDATCVEFIKELDVIDGKFKRTSKNDLLRMFNYETEAHIYLSRHYFFKK